MRFPAVYPISSCPSFAKTRYPNSKVSYEITERYSEPNWRYTAAHKLVPLTNQQQTDVLNYLDRPTRIGVLTLPLPMLEAVLIKLHDAILAEQDEVTFCLSIPMMTGTDDTYPFDDDPPLIVRPTPADPYEMLALIVTNIESRLRPEQMHLLAAAKRCVERRPS